MIMSVKKVEHKLEHEEFLKDLTHFLKAFQLGLTFTIELT